ncbi:MAG TPA: RNA ligase family protein [Tepidisphaeraceae bacterium]|jgi:hypothetical protein|nr:RNA ligase family protein [Tepidisphaeraceae bacterium]
MIRKYPRTRHVLGSRKQPGDEDLDSVPFSALLGRHVVIEEKMDGANCAFSFSPEAELRLQSRGHYLSGGPRERHFDLFKRWAHALDGSFFDVIGNRYVVYGEWLHVKHTVFYDALPHYFMEFDVLDLQSGDFLDTPRRDELLHGLPVVPVKVLFSGELKDEAHLVKMLADSRFISPQAPANLRRTAEGLRLDPEQVLAQSDATGLMEGLYIKVEEDGVVKERLKFVRRDFITRIIESDGHWMERPIVPNSLREGIDIFDPGGFSRGGGSQ